MDQKAIIVSTITKKEAKRLIQFFPDRTVQKPHSGRVQGKHPIEAEQRTREDSSTFTATWDRHPHGRSVRKMHTTNRFTCLIEWSNSCSALSDNAPVVVQVFKIGGGRFFKIRVAPHRSNEREGRALRRDAEFSQENAFETFRIIRKPSCIKIQLGSRHFIIHKDDVGLAQRRIWWELDHHRFDKCVEFVDNISVVTHRRQQWTNEPTIVV